jgi:hypothetical protein
MEAAQTDILAMAAVVMSKCVMGTMGEEALGAIARDLVHPDGDMRPDVIGTNTQNGTAIVSKLAARDVGRWCPKSVVADGAPLAFVIYLEDTLAIVGMIMGERKEAKLVITVQL